MLWYLLCLSVGLWQERGLVLVLDARPDLEQVKVEISSLEDLVLSGSNWRNFLSWPGNDWGTVWTHPELLPQVALINHTNISLTHCACLGKTLFYQLLKVCVLLDMIEQSLGGSFYCSLPLLNCGQLHWSNSGALGLWPLSERPWSFFPLDWSTFPRSLPEAVSSLQVSSFQNIGTWAVTLILWIRQPNFMPKWTQSFTKTGWIYGCCRTCFWVKSSSPPLYIFNHMKKACVSFMK